MSPSIHVGQSFSSPWEASNDSMSAPSPVQWPALLPSSRELEPTLALAEFISQVVLLFVGPPSFLENNSQWGFWKGHKLYAEIVYLHRSIKPIQMTA